MNNPFEYAKGLSKNGIFINFYGPISQAILVELGIILKQKLRIENVDNRTIHKIFALLVEQTQNIISYFSLPSHTTESKSTCFKSGVISVGADSKNYFILTSNKVINSDIDSLRDKLNRLKEMPREELKTYYKSKLKERGAEAPDSDLRLIELFRKSNTPIEYNFEQMNADYSFFFLKSTVKN